MSLSKRVNKYKIQFSCPAGPVWVRGSREQRQVVKVVAALPLRGEVYVDHVVGAGHETYEAGQQEHRTLEAAAGLRQAYCT